MSRECRAFHSLFAPLSSLRSYWRGCAAPGEPYERKPPTPAAVTDLPPRNRATTLTSPSRCRSKRWTAARCNIFPQSKSIATLRKAAGRRAAAHRSPRIGSHAAGHHPRGDGGPLHGAGPFRYTDSLRAEDFAQHPDSVAITPFGRSLARRKPLARFQCRYPCASIPPPNPSPT